MSFVRVDRDTPLLLPVDLRDWISPAAPVHFVLEAVDRADLSCFHVSRTGSGKAQYPPRMLLALLIHCYSQGVFSSRMPGLVNSNKSLKGTLPLCLPKPNRWTGRKKARMTSPAPMNRAT